MKKLVTLLAAAGMVVAASAPASAVDVKVDARYRTSFKTGETGFTGANQEAVTQRLRLGLTMAASENLSAYANFQFGAENWGTSNDTNGMKGSIQTRMLYLDWKVPGTPVKVRMGRQNLGLPADAFGHNAVMAAGWGTRDGIVVAAPVTDWMGVTALWARLGLNYTAAGSADTALDTNESNDFFGLAANLKFNGISGSVYGAYAAIDNQIDQAARIAKFGAKNGLNFKAEHGNAWWIGGTATLSYFDPFTLKLSAAYGSFESSADSKNDTAGWNVQAKASYKMDFGTPVLGAWYFSGYDKDNDGLMPSMTGYFTPTRTWNDAAKGLNGGQGFGTPTGNWGVQLGVENVSFLQGLSHDFLVSYIEGTNDKDCTAFDADDSKKKGMWLTEDDSLVEFDFISTYQIYKNLAAHLELSYIISDFDDAKGAKNATLTEDDWRAELTFEFKF